MAAALGCRVPPGAALLITAHPDDESMFFLPTVLGLRADNIEVHLLCLSTGNAEGLGSVRTQELSHACRLLGITSVQLVDDPSLPDGMDALWSPTAVMGHVAAAVAAHKPSSLITFDTFGVSGHQNHVAVNAGVGLAVWQMQHAGAAAPALFTLASTWLPRKFLGPADLPLSALTALALPNSVAAYMRVAPWLAWRAMRAHRSQFVWYRRLHVLLSRYTYVNTLWRCVTN